MWISSCSGTICWKTIFLHCAAFVRDRSTLFVRLYFWALRSVQLMYLFFCQLLAALWNLLLNQFTETLILVILFFIPTAPKCFF
jgi:hypothetical protein